MCDQRQDGKRTLVLTQLARVASADEIQQFLACTISNPASVEIDQPGPVSTLLLDVA